MAIYEIGAESMKRVEATSFAAEGIQERADLQRLLRDQIDVLVPGVLVISEEYGNWSDSNRRIDLLGIDEDANLIVIELKRTDSGGHMELQAIRYAAMVSSMTFEQVVDAHAGYLRKRTSDADARSAILEFLGWDEPLEDDFAQEVRILLVGPEFSKEITTAVMWLNTLELDIRCIRIKPYLHAGSVLVDVQQIIPLPEAEEYQIQIKEKARQERQAKTSSRSYQKYDVTVGGTLHSKQPKRRAIFLLVKHVCESGGTPGDIAKIIEWRSGRLWRSVDGVADAEDFAVKATNAAEGGGKAFDKRRWYCSNDDDLIVSGGKTYVFSNQWGHRTDEAMELLIAKYPDVGLQVEPFDQGQ